MNPTSFARRAAALALAVSCFARVAGADSLALDDLVPGGNSTGAFDICHDSGEKLCKGRFEKGRPVGEWRFFHENGERVDLAAISSTLTLGPMYFVRGDSFLRMTYFKGLRMEFVFFDLDKPPHFVCRHFRGVEILPGNHCQTVLVRNLPCTNCSRVRLVDLATGEARDIDEGACRDFNASLGRTTSFCTSHYVGFSKDDKRILLCVINLSSKTDVWAEGGHRYYVVESATGRMLESFEKDELPKRWKE